MCYTSQYPCHSSIPICLRDHCPAAEADVYAPCALEGTLSERAIGHLLVSIHSSMRPVEFGEASIAGTRLTLFSDDKPVRFFTVTKFWMDETSGVALALKGGVPTYQVEDGLPRRRLAGGGRKAELI
jgi:hypothetical protein